MEEDSVAMRGPCTSNISATLSKKERKNVLNPDLTAALDLQK